MTAQTPLAIRRGKDANVAAASQTLRERVIRDQMARGGDSAAERTAG
jgi:hypothetical protein